MITVKEEFLVNAKTQRAIRMGGYEILALWLGLKRYAAENLTDGFVPDEDIETLPGAPKGVRKALKALVECGRVASDGSRGFGLVDPVPGGWQLHRYLDHASGRDEIELKREKARIKKQIQRNKHRLELEAIRGTSQRVPGGQPRGQDGGTTQGTGWGDNPGPSPRVRPGPRAHVPNPPQPNPTQPKENSALGSPSETQFGATREELLTQPPPPSGVRKSSPPPAPSAPVPAKRNTFIAPHHQEDVIRAFGLWRDWAKQPAATLSYGDPRARLIQDRLDTYGPESFELMLLGASKDDMVQGRKDGIEHKRLDYLLGNPSPARYEELLLAGSRLRARERKPVRQAPRHIEQAEPEETPEERFAAIEELKLALAKSASPQREAVNE